MIQGFRSDAQFLLESCQHRGHELLSLSFHQAAEMPAALVGGAMDDDDRNPGLALGDLEAVAAAPGVLMDLPEERVGGDARANRGFLGRNFGGKTDGGHAGPEDPRGGRASEGAIHDAQIWIFLTGWQLRITRLNQPAPDVNAKGSRPVAWGSLVAV